MLANNTWRQSKFGLENDEKHALLCSWAYLSWALLQSSTTPTPILRLLRKNVVARLLAFLLAWLAPLSLTINTTSILSASMILRSFQKAQTLQFTAKKKPFALIKDINQLSNCYSTTHRSMPPHISICFICRTTTITTKISKKNNDNSQTCSARKKEWDDRK